ncbi:MAG: membrane protease subunit HflK [Moritella sp.]|jgi:membrane protease subunit HflK
MEMQMAWNEPGNGGNKDRDPWGQKGKDQGPPDLDEVFKKLTSKFGGMGDKFSGGGSNFNKVGISLVLGVLAVIWVVSGFYTIKEAERGVVLRLGQYSATATPGLSWLPTFIDRVIPVDVKSVRSMPAKGSMLTMDENVVDVNMDIQYRVINPREYLFSVINPDDSLHQAIDSALRYVIGHTTMDDVITTGREVVRHSTREHIETIIGDYNMGIELVDVNFLSARPPEAVKEAFDDAIAAQEDEQRYIREAEAYAREIEPTARGRVKRIGQEAEAYQQQIVLKAQGEVARFESLLPHYQLSPEVTRQRLYLETMEQVYSNTTKVVVDTEGSGNMLYLPLDKIINSSNAGQVARPANTVQAPQKPPIANSRYTYPDTDTNVRPERFNAGRN